MSQNQSLSRAFHDQDIISVWHQQSNSMGHLRYLVAGIYIESSETGHLDTDFLGFPLSQNKY
jgi:hypothetical protein